MKLPRILGEIQDFQTPTRRKFLQGVGALTLPKLPIKIGEIGEILDGEKVGDFFYGALNRLPVRFFEYERWEKGSEGQLVGFPTEHQPIIQRRIKSELYGYIPDLGKLLGNSSDLLRFFDPENSYLQPEVSSYEANLESGDINGEFDFLDMVLGFKIPGDNEDEEYYLELNICPCEVGINEPLNIGDSGVTLGRIDKVLGRITDEYEISLMDDKDIFEVLRMPIKDLLPVFKEKSWHKNHEAEREKQNKQEMKQLPVLLGDFQEQMNQILTGKIVITAEIRHRVGVLLSR